MYNLKLIKTEIETPHVVRFMAYPGSEFFVANTLAKRKKSNEIDFSQEFSQNVHVVSRSFSEFYSLSASSDFYHLLIIFSNSLDPDQARQTIGPDLDPNCLAPKIQHPNKA